MAMTASTKSLLVLCIPTLEQSKILEANPISIHGTHFTPNLVAVVAIYQDALDSSSNFKPDVTWCGIDKSDGGLIATQYADDFLPRSASVLDIESHQPLDIEDWLYLS
ncbi:hypothetical protein AB5N19_07177 [Seiridium cardinale]